MATQISPMLAVSDGAAAIEFYKQAFGAEELWRLGEDGAVAGLSIDGARFFLAVQSPPATRSPSVAGHTTVRIELFVDDPQGVQERAVAAGGQARSPVIERQHETTGPSPDLRVLQGSVTDPFGHVWLIGKFLD
ncbi:MAG: VOC family protein [Dehalococcoidia bacterium]|nr:VOC family protein [Dehalococcoidia bacterium]